MAERIFVDEWRECLRAQYKHVIRNDDQITLRTLVDVLHEVGFTDDELNALRIEATLRADEMPDDFVPPEIEALEPAEAVEAVIEPVEIEISDEVEFIEPEAELEAEPDEMNDLETDDSDDSVEDDPDAPQQMFMF